MDDDLDDLLNDALSDFDKPPPDDKKTKKVMKDSGQGTSSEQQETTGAEGAMGGERAPTEIFDQFFDKDISAKLQQEWENAMKELVDDDPALASQLKNLPTSLGASEEEDAAESASASGSSKSAPSNEEARSSATAASQNQPPGQMDLKKLMDAAISDIGGSADELKNMTSSEAEEKLLNEMKNMGLGGMSDMMGGDLSDLRGLEGDFMQMMEGMMGNLLSKDVLYPTMKEISKIYPQWLADNEGKVPDGDFQRYKKQTEIIDKICKAFEEEDENAAKDVKSQRLNVMMNLVEQMQECGNPPKDLLEKCGSVDSQKFFGGHPGFDPSAFDPNNFNPEKCNVM